MDKNQQILDQYSNLNFVQRIKNPAIFPNIPNPDGSISTHLMAAETDENGNWYVFPTIVQNEDGSLEKLELREAQRRAIRSGEFIPFGKDATSAMEFSAGGYKTPQMTGNQYQQGRAPVVTSGLTEVLNQGQHASATQPYLDPSIQMGSYKNPTKIRVNVRGLDKPIEINIPSGEAAEQFMKNPTINTTIMLRNKFSELTNAVETISANMTPEEKAMLVAGQLPAVGELQDAHMYITDPESRTLFNFMMSGAGVVGFPGAAAYRAAEKAAKNIDNLPMDSASRMARANEGGWRMDKPLYHYTDKDFEEFKLPKNPNFQQLGEGVYASPDKMYGERYVRDYKSGELKDGANVVPVVTRGDLASPEDYKKASREVGFGGGLNQQQRKIQEILKGQGFAGIDMNNEVLIFDPVNVRSVNAKFDPAKKDSSNILAGGAAGAIGLGALTNRDQESGAISPESSLKDL